MKNEDCTVIIRERTQFNRDILNALSNLRLLVTSGPKNSAIDLQVAKDNKVIVSGTKNLKEPPAELAIALILNLARHITQENFAFRHNGAWQHTLGMSLSGKTLGILGLGAIGGHVAKIAQAMDMKVMAWSENLSKETAIQHGVELASSKELLVRHSDVISIHLHLSERTRNLINKTEFYLMKPTTLLINTSRAEIINQEATVKALQSKLIAGAVADVFAEEPLPADNPLRN